MYAPARKKARSPGEKSPKSSKLDWVDHIYLLNYGYWLTYWRTFWDSYNVVLYVQHYPLSTRLVIPPFFLPAHAWCQRIHFSRLLFFAKPPSSLLHLFPTRSGKRGSEPNRRLFPLCSCEDLGKVLQESFFFSFSFPSIKRAKDMRFYFHPFLQPRRPIFSLIREKGKRERIRTGGERPGRRRRRKKLSGQREEEEKKEERRMDRKGSIVRATKRSLSKSPAQHQIVF